VTKKRTGTHRPRMNLGVSCKGGIRAHTQDTPRAPQITIWSVFCDNFAFSIFET
jgi:hypothetical protein